MGLSIERPVEDAVIQQEYTNKALQSLYELSNLKDAKAVELVVVEELTLEQAGERLGFGKENTRQHKNRGLSGIRGRLASLGFDLKF